MTTIASLLIYAALMLSAPTTSNPAPTKTPGTQLDHGILN